MSNTQVFGGLERFRAPLRWLAAIGFLLAGAKHFYRAEFYRQIVPPMFPSPAALIAIRGVVEIIGGVGLLIPRLRRAAGWGLIALLIAVFPANIYMAISPRFAEQLHFQPWVLWLRLPMQVLFIWWIWFVALASSGRSNLN